MTVLVTGAQGFIGRYVVAALLDAGHAVIGTGRSVQDDTSFTHAIDDTQPFRAARLPDPLRRTIGDAPSYRYERCDLACDQQVDAMMADITPTRVLHLAAALRDESWTNLMTSNVQSTLNLLHTVARLPSPPHVVLGSSGSVYGDQTKMPIAEDALPRPIGPYATTKLMAELAASEIARAAGFPLSIARIFNVIGPGLQPRHLPGYLAHRIAVLERDGKPARLALGDISTVRDFIDVRDVAACLATTKGWATASHVNIAGAPAAIADIVQMFITRSAVPLEIVHDSARSRVGSTRVEADTTILRKFHEPGISLSRSVDDMLAFARAQQRFNATP